MKNLDEIKNRLRTLLVDTLVLDGIRPEDIDDDEPLFEGRLDLDSLDAMEIVVLLQRHFGLKVENPRQGKRIMASLDTLARWIDANRR